jgi:hypothetical protein
MTNNLIYLGVITLVVGFSTLMTTLSLPNLPGMPLCYSELALETREQMTKLVEPQQNRGWASQADGRDGYVKAEDSLPLVQAHVCMIYS